LSNPLIIDLDHEPWEQLDGLLKRKTVHGSSMTLTRYRFKAGGRFPNHRHEQEQITLVLDGTLTFSTADGAYEVERGAAIVIPPRVAHSAVAGDEGAEVVSIVSPARTEDRGVQMLEGDR
jgi:quercetin dioxygenase-like cupin family protein